MSKSRKSLTILACAVVPVVYGTVAMAQDVVTPVQYADGNPPTLPGFWPNSVQSPTQGASATGTDPVITSNAGNALNVNGSPNNGDSGVISGGTPPSNGTGALVNILENGASGGFAVLGQTFMPTSSFKLGGISFDMTSGADSGFQADGASIHLYQFQPGTVNGTSASYNLSTQSTGVDLLGGGNGAVWTPSATSNLNQFVFTGVDQVQLQANTEYVFEIFVDTNDTGDSVGVMRTSGSNTNPQPYSNGQLYGIGVGTTGSSTQSYSANFALARSDAVFAGAGLIRELPFAIYGAPPVTTTGTWTGAATGGSNSDWTNPGNWTASAVPGGTPGDSALFGVGASSVNVSLNGTQTLGRLTFNGPSYTVAQGSGGTLTMEGTSVSATAHIDDLFGNSTITAPVALASPTQFTVGQATNTLTISGNINGAGSVTLTGDSTIAVQAGVVMFSGSNSYGGGTTVNSGTLIANDGVLVGTAPNQVLTNEALPANSAVTIANGTLQLGSTTGLVTLSSLAITGNGTLDVNNNHVIVNYGSGTDPITSIAALLKTGYNAGAWNGAGGIDSSAAAANNPVAGNLQYGLGYADFADPGNPAGLASGTIEIKYTLLGDANLSGVVDGTDFGVVAANFNKGVSRWDQGDFNYDSVVDGTDFGDMAANFNKGASGAAAWQALVTFAAANGLLADVPEPASIGLIALSACGLLARRSRRRSNG